MKHRILAFILIGAMLASLLSACGDDSRKLIEGRTLFIYLCGSNLETKQGLASKSIDELLSADTGDLNIVIQTGGAKQWREHDIDDRAAQRYEIRDGELVLLETLNQLNMGDPKTLTDFLTWGQEQYPTDHNMLILWDHGGGSVKGVCFDENYGFNSLTLPELKTALEEADLNTKFDIIGFDACLMATIETAAAISNYANYMVASEEIEPSGGWDYKALAESFAKESGPIEVGKNICDAYMEKCENNGKSLMATLSLFDLSHTDEMLAWCDVSAELLDTYSNDADYATTVFEAMNVCEKYGGDNSYQGSANMLDFRDFFGKAVGDMETNTVDVFITVDSFIKYKVCGKGHPNAGGFSFYYPMIYNEQEIRDYISLGVSGYYKQYLSNYYLDIPDVTVGFADMGSVTDDGAYSVTLTPESDVYMTQIDYVLMSTDESGIRHILSTDNDITKDWENLIFDSNFRGITLALDGHPLFYTTVSSNERFVTFSAPVKVNGESTTLRFVFIWDESYFNDGYYAVTGLWSGYDENGLPDNDITQLKQGDRIQVVTDVVQENGRYIETYSEEFIIGKDGGTITETPLDGKEYQYVYVATDMYGNTIFSDMATFEMTISYEELLENPLPDNTYAAKVTGIEPYDIELPKE